jgi:hypothetical protein
VPGRALAADDITAMIANAEPPPIMKRSPCTTTGGRRREKRQLHSKMLKGHQDAGRSGVTKWHGHLPDLVKEYESAKMYTEMARPSRDAKGVK